MQETATRVRAAPPRVIVAEDDVEMAHVLSFLLQREGYEVEVVRDGKAAIDRTRSGPPVDLVLLDVMMPYISGLQVVRELRAAPGWEGVPVIIVSGKSSETDVVAAMEAGANDYVTKPFRPRELIARARGQIARHRPRRVA